VAEWAATGKKVEEMAVATGWSAYTLYRWRSDIRATKAPKKQEGGTKLLAVPKPVSTMSGAWAAEVMMGSGLSVRLLAGCTRAWAAQLWALVSGLEVRAWRRPEKDRVFPKKELASA